MRKLRVLGIALVIGLLGAGAAFAVSKHTGSSTLDCNGAHVDYTSFANANNNTVNEQLLVNGNIVVTKTFVLQNGSSGHDDIPFPTPLNGTYTVQVKANWNTNGHSGSFDSGVKTLGCFTVTTTTTRTVTGPTVTVTNPTVTVTNPTQTVTNPTVTVQLPAPPAEVRTVTNTVTTAAPPAKTVTVVKTVKSPPKIKIVYKTKKAPICKPKRIVPKPPILLPTK